MVTGDQGSGARPLGDGPVARDPRMLPTEVSLEADDLPGAGPAGPPVAPLPPPPPSIGGVRPPGPLGEWALGYTPHLQELRERLIKAAVALVLTTALSFLFTDTIFDILKSRSEGVQLIRTGVAEMVGTYMRVAFISGVVLATPVWLYQIIAFISPGLTSQERRLLFTALPAVLACFLCGVLFGFFVLLPPALNFLIHFGEDIAAAYIRVGDYVSVVTNLLFCIGVVFETPLVIYLLARLGIVTPQLLGRFRRYAIVLAFVVGAVITPTPDPVNQTLVAVPIILLYEVGILLAKVAVRVRRGDSK